MRPSRLRPVRDWLLLRAAGVQGDSAKRAATFATVTLRCRAGAHPVDRRAGTRAFADALGAATRYAALGATVTALRLRLSRRAGQRDARRRSRASCSRSSAANTGSADAKTAVEVLDKGFTCFTPAEELVIARSAGTSGPPARAVTAFERALGAARAHHAERSADSTRRCLSRGRPHARRVRAARVGPRTARGTGGYQRARILLTSGTGDATRAALRDVVERFPNDTSARAPRCTCSPISSPTTGDDDAGAYALSASSIAQVSDEPACRDATLPCGDHRARRTATRRRPRWSSIRSPRAMPRSDEAIGRALLERPRVGRGGESTPWLEQRWRDVIAQQPVVLLRRRCAPSGSSKQPWAPTARAPIRSRALPRVDSAMARVALLERLGMDAEARFEYDALEAAASVARPAARRRRTRFSSTTSRRERFAWRRSSSTLGQRDARAYRLLFPVLDREELARDAKARASRSGARRRADSPGVELQSARACRWPARAA